MELQLQGKTALITGSLELTRGTEVTVKTVLPGPTETEGADTVIKGAASRLACHLHSVLRNG
jgi:short-subunit dehydrogenase